jgi:hypothetical protein
LRADRTQTNRAIIQTALTIAAAGLAAFIACCGRSTEPPATAYQLTVLAGAGGTISAPSSTTVAVGNNEAIVIKAISNAGYAFLKWTTATECAAIAYKNAASTTVRLLSGSDTVQAVFVPAPSGLAPVNLPVLGRLERGASYYYYTGTWTSLPDFSALDPDRSDSCGTFDIAGVPRRQNGFGIVFSGYIDIPFNGDYSLYVKSSDGSALLLNDSLLILNNGIHPVPEEDSARVTLAAGKYLITVRYFDANSEPACTVSYACPSIGIDKQPVSNGILSRPYTGPVSKIIITKPAGGDTYHLGDSMQVQWIYRHFDHMVFCEISTNNGKTYTMLSLKAFAHVDTNGYMGWKIPANDSLLTDSARVRVRDYPPGVNACVSNVFSIVPQVLKN